MGSFRRDGRGRRGSSGPATAAFAPSTLSGLLLWTRSDTVVGSPVSQWTDKSGNGNHLNAAGAAQPAYVASDAAYGGQASLTFNGTSNVMNTSGTLTYGPFTEFLVIKNTVADAMMYYVSDGAAVEYLYADAGFSGFVSRVAVGGGSGGYNISAGWGANAAVRTIQRVFNGTLASFGVRINGVDQTLSLVGSDPGSTPYTGTVYVGASPTPASFVTGSMAEVIVYNRALSGTEVSQVESYLRTRYGHY